MIGKTVKIHEEEGSKFAGSVGIVRKINESGFVYVEVEGIHNGKPLMGSDWFAPEHLEVVGHG